jgi:hypothetical protein
LSQTPVLSDLSGLLEHVALAALALARVDAANAP